MKKILIISSEYTGHGHKSVDTALLQYFKLKYKDKIECKVINGFKLGDQKLKQMEMLYNPCIKYLPNLWEKIFSISNKNGKFLNKNTSRAIQKKFLQVINSYKPNLILSVHPMFNGSILNILEKNNIHNIEFYTLITDLITVSKIWLDNRSTKIISPSKEATDFIINNGIDKDKVLTFGIPVRDHFVSKYNTIEEVKENTNFNNKLRVLILNNTEKSKRISYMIKNIHQKYDCDITVVCGRNKNNYIRLKNRLKNYDKPVNIIGYTKELFNLFYENDVLITRCGTLSVVEAINCIIPIISMGALPGQEEDTPIYLENNNLGYNTSSTDDIFKKIDLLLENNRERLLKIREAQFNYYGRNVTTKIVEYIANQLIND